MSITFKTVRFRDCIESSGTGLDALKRAPLFDYDPGLRCIRIQDISQNKPFEMWAFAKTTEKDFKQYQLKKDDVILVRTGGTIGVSYLVKKDLQAVFNNGTIRFRFNSKVNVLYMYALMKTKSFMQYIDNISCVATQPNLRIDVLQNFQFNLPDLDSQNKISNVLACYDEAIENNNKRIKLLEQMAQNLYKEWFVCFRFPGWENCEFENGIPKGWNQLKLDDIADIIMGQSPESCYYNYEKKGLPFHQGCSNYGEFYLIDEIYSTKGSRFAEPGSIIFSVRAPVGKLNITFNKIILGRGVAAINSKTGKNAFLYWLLKNKFSKEDMIGNGSVFASVTKYELLQQKFLIPPEDIIDSFDLFANNIERMMRALYKQNTNLVKQRDLLLPRLMSGKLEV